MLRASAEKGEGIAEVVAEIARHRAHLEASGELDAKRTERARFEILEILKDRLLASVAGREGFLADAAARVAERKEDPASAADRLFDTWRRA